MKKVNRNMKRPAKKLSAKAFVKDCAKHFAPPATKNKPAARPLSALASLPTQCPRCRGARGRSSCPLCKGSGVTK